MFSCDVHVPRDASKIRWHANMSQHLPYIACHPNFDNPILQCLICTYRTVSIKQNGGWHFLDPEIQDKWLRLEKSLLWMANTLLSGSRANLPLGFDPGPLPTSCGYLNNHAEERFARHCAIKSRDAFVPLMALCSWSIALVGNSMAMNKVPRWVDMLQANPTVLPSWIEDLAHSMIADFTIRRTGSFMECTDEEVKRVIGPMLRANVPIWIFWGDLSKPTMSYDRSLERYRPTTTQVHAAGLSLKQRNMITPAISLPQGTRQMPGEEWRSYFTRMAANHSVFEQKESTLQKKKRLARENHSRTGEAPGRKGATVFYWERHDSGFRFRRQVPRAGVAQLWEEYAPAQRRYDGFTDEWDICTEFDPSAVHPEDEDEDDMPETQLATDGTTSSSKCPNIPPTTSGFGFSHDRLDMSVWTEENSGYQPELSSRMTNTTSHDTIIDIARCRYGLIIDSTLRDNPSLPSWDVARRALGSEAQDTINPHAKNSIRELVGSLLEVANDVVRYPPKAIWDLNKHGDEYLFGRSNFVISLHPEKTNIGTICWIESRDLHPSRNAPWRLLVTNPATAIECLRRRWGPHLVDIAAELCSRGIAFKTCIASERHVAIDQSQPTVLGLGYRLSGYIPLKRDYETYESIRNNFLRTPRARAALLKGGIVWRLARDIVTEAAVLSGPSSEVYHTGGQVICSSGTLVDDELSDDELNLISGVYKVFTGKLPYRTDFCID